MVVLAKFLPLFLCVTTSSVEAATYVFKRDKNNRVEFESSITPGSIPVVGSGGFIEGTVRGDASGFSASFILPVNSFKTGIALRDDHMRTRYFESGKYPLAKLVIEKFLPVKDGTKFLWKGKLTIKDSTKPVVGDALVTSKRLIANFIVNLTDYSFEPTSWLGAVMSEKIRVRVDATAHEVIP